MRSTEKQLAYLVACTNCLLGYGMPSANSRLTIQRQMADMGSDGDMAQQQQQQYIDFIICSRIIYLCRVTNELVKVSAH